MILNSIRLQIMLCRLIIHSVMVVFIIAFLHLIIAWWKMNHFSVYDKFVEVDRHFRNCMKKHISLPNFILNRIIKANYNISQINFAIIWGKKNISLHENVRFGDKLIMYIVYKLALFRRYKLICK